MGANLSNTRGPRGPGPTRNARHTGSAKNLGKATQSKIQEVEKYVDGVIAKTSEPGLVIDENIQQEIIAALIRLKCEADNSRVRRTISPRSKNSRPVDVNTAIQAVNNLPSKKFKYISTEQDPDKIRTEIFKIKKRIDVIDKSDAQNELERLSAMTQKLSKIFDGNEKSEISLLMLKLFIRCPQMNVRDTLRSNVNHLRKIVNTFEQLSSRDIPRKDAEEIGKLLKNIVLNTDVIKSLCQDITTKTESIVQNRPVSKELVDYGQTTHFPTRTQIPNDQIVITPVNSYQSNLSEKLDQNRKKIEKLQPPINERDIKHLEHEISSLQLQIEQTKTESPKILKQRKAALATNLQKLKILSDKNKHVHDNFKKVIEDEMFGIIEKNIDFTTKKQLFSICREKIKKFHPNCDGVCRTISNKIETLMVIQTTSRLREILREANQEEVFSEEFSSTKEDIRYKNKEQDLQKLMGQLLEIQSQSPRILERINNIKKKISGVFTTLEKKAAYNTQVLKALKTLEDIEQQIRQPADGGNYITKLNSFNNHRNKMITCDGNNKNILQRKRNLYTLIHQAEDEIFGNSRTRIKQLHEYEMEALQYVYPKSINIYQQMRSKMETFVYTFKQTLISINNPQLTTALSEMGDLLLKHLDTNFNGNKKIRESLDRLTKNEDELDQMKLKETNWIVLKRIKDKEEEISLQKSKNDLQSKTDTFKKCRQTINISLPAENFIAKMEEILLLKESVEDMPPGDPNLDSQKKKFLQDFTSYFKSLDERFEMLVIAKQPENLIDLSDQFVHTNNPVLAKNIQNKHDVVRNIVEKARAFEDRVRYYLGTNDSVDYYVIHENLSRFLLELDKISVGGDQELLMELVEAINYVKGLMEQLDSNGHQQNF